LAFKNAEQLTRDDKTEFFPPFQVNHERLLSVGRDSWSV